MNPLSAISLAWTTVLQIVALSGLVSVVLVPLGTWLVLRFAKPLDSYTEELAKQVTRHQNLGMLVEETRHVTDAVEKIKSELSHETWDRQTRLLAKRDLYVRIAEALGELRNSYVTTRGLEPIRLQAAAQGRSSVMYEGKREETLRALNEATDKWHRATDTAPLMIPDEPFKPLREFRPRQIRFGTPYWEKDFAYDIGSVQWVLYHFQVAARRDLGFEPMVWTPTLLSPSPPDPQNSTGVDIPEDDASPQSAAD